MAKFSEVLCIVNGKNQRKVENPNGKYPIYGSGGIMGYANDYLCDANTVVIGRKGSINNPIYVETPFWNVDTAFGLCSDVSKLYPKYLYYFCVNFDFEQLNTTVTIPSLTKSNLLNIEIPLPPLDEQRRIAAVLDKVSDLTAKRRAQLDKLDELVKARFVEMFGDPVDNPYDWAVAKLMNFGECKNGLNFHTDDSGVKIHCLGVGDFKDLSIIEDTSKLPTISLNEMPCDDYLLANGDIVFVRSNGNKALVGRSVVVYPNDITTTFSGFCIRFRIQNSAILPSYLLRVLKTDSMRKKMAGRGANIQNLNQKILTELRIPIPGLALQEEFELFLKKVDNSKLTIQQSLDKLKILKKALMQQYFG